MCQTKAELAAHALALLLDGNTPEEVEAALTATVGTQICLLDYRPTTALSDPTNVLMQEVSDDAGA